MLQGYVAEGLDLGPSFDPEDNTDHRYQYVVADSPVSIMPTLDYYGFEHEDAITGEGLALGFRSRVLGDLGFFADSPISIIPTPGYYGFEHKDAITGG